mmetsp:Transcript_1206/g.2443  ORF Transcript_1206/g.2443 Transcript_1206/m.2443 type:complete len:360 (+) Transcript_1206:623-1702(+)
MTPSNFSAQTSWLGVCVPERDATYTSVGTGASSSPATASRAAASPTASRLERSSPEVRRGGKLQRTPLMVYSSRTTGVRRGPPTKGHASDLVSGTPNRAAWETVTSGTPPRAKGRVGGIVTSEPPRRPEMAPGRKNFPPSSFPSPDPVPRGTTATVRHVWLTAAKATRAATRAARPHIPLSLSVPSSSVAIIAPMDDALEPPIQLRKASAAVAAALLPFSPVRSEAGHPARSIDPPDASNSLRMVGDNMSFVDESEPSELSEEMTNHRTREPREAARTAIVSPRPAGGLTTMTLRLLMCNGIVRLLRSGAIGENAETALGEKSVQNAIAATVTPQILIMVRYLMMIHFLELYVQVGLEA